VFHVEALEVAVDTKAVIRWHEIRELERAGNFGAGAAPFAFERRPAERGGADVQTGGDRRPGLGTIERAFALEVEGGGCDLEVAQVLIGEGEGMEGQLG